MKKTIKVYCIRGELLSYIKSHVDSSDVEVGIKLVITRKDAELYPEKYNAKFQRVIFKGEGVWR